MEENAIGVIIAGIILAIIVITIKSSDKIGNIYIKVFIAIRNLKLHVKAIYKDLNILNRDIDVDYSPAMLSYLYNLKLEPKKDILATILNLYNKKVMTIKKVEGGYNFIPIQEADLSSLTEDEYYIYCSFIEDKENAKLFSFKYWEDIIKEEYKSYKFSENKKQQVNYKIYYTISIVIGVILTLLLKNKLLNLLLGSNINQLGFETIAMSILFFIVITVIGMIPIYFIYDTILYIKQLLKKLNNKGKEEIVKWIKFKKFIKEYTLLEDRKIEEVVIYEKYIPYAMVLNVNKEYNNKEIAEFVNDYMKLVNKGAGKYLYTDVFPKNN